jgi:PAS domain S-box-containing protein
MNPISKALKWHAIAVVSIALCIGLNLALRPLLGPAIFAPFLIAVLVNSLYGGAGPGLTAVLLSLPARCYLLDHSPVLQYGPVAFALRVGIFSGVELVVLCLMLSHRRQHRTLRESERRFRSVAEALPQLVWTTRPDGWVTYFNRRCAEVTGLAPGTGLGEGWLNAVHPEDRDSSLATWKAALRSGTPFEVEYRLRCADGSYRWFLGRGLPSKDESGNVIEWFGTCTDIDLQKQAIAAMAEATESKDRFLAVLSHELRSPLTPVLLSVTAMLEGPRVCPTCSPTLKLIRDNVALEARLIDDLLDVSRITRGKMLYRFETIDVHALIRRCLEICAADAAIKRHNLTIELDAGDHFIHGDPVRLQQVLWNLLSNAVKYTPECGRILVSSRTIGGRIFVKIADNGVGIKPDDLPHIFDAFRRGHGAELAHQSGLGLGLTISRSIVEAHGGTLRVTSEGQNRGATFVVELATVTTPSRHHGASPAAPRRSAFPLRILLAEDNLATVRTTADLLRKKGHLVTAATSLTQALEVLSDEFDVVVSDIELGDGSGLDLMRRLRALSALPGIALSGYATKDDIRQSLDAGFSLHLAKPVTFATLETAIEEVAAARTSLACSSDDTVDLTPVAAR